MKKIRIEKSGDFRIEIKNPGDEVEIIGLFHGTGSDDININLTIVHQAPHTRAKTMLKGVAEGNSRIRFFGRIIIQENCGDTQSFLEERILLLSDTAKAEAVPELEILTDDVKCSHAASVSSIPEEEVFYLQSRGIPKKNAEAMIVAGFLSA